MKLLDGTTYSRQDVQAAVDLLEAAPSDKIRETLAAGGNPLANCAYRAIAKQHDPDGLLVEYAPSKAGPRRRFAKPAFLDYLRGLLAG